MMTYTFEAVINGTETLFEISEEKLSKLMDSGVVKLSEDGTAWVLNEDSEHYDLAVTLLSLGD